MIDVGSTVPLKANPPIVVTLVGIVTEVNPVCEKAHGPIETTLVGIVTDISPEHP